MMHPPASDSPRPSSVGSTQSSQSSSTRARGKHEICVGEELKIATDIAIERFRLSEEQKGIGPTWVDDDRFDELLRCYRNVG